MHDVRGKTIYLSGPMTRLPGLNRAAFEKARDRLLGMGAGYVYSPVCLPDGHSHEGYMAHSIAVLVSKRDCYLGAPMHYDLLVSLPGWEGSEGARLERAVAGACGIPCAEIGEVVA